MVKIKKCPNQKTIKELFYYKNGELYWKINNKIAGYISNNDRRIIMIKYKNYVSHRLIWVYFNGDIPAGMQIDHLDHNKKNNRIENLRLVSFCENCKNLPLRKDNKSGCVGVKWEKRYKKRWVAEITVNKKNIYLGSFINKQDAINARKAAEIKYGFHANHGKERG